MTAHEDIRGIVEAQIDGPETSNRYLRTTDSAAIASIADSLADRLRELEVDGLLAWDRADDAVVTHALSTALGGIRVVRADLDLGLWSIEGTWPETNGRFALVSADWSGGTAAPLAALCTERGQTVRAVVSVLRDGSDVAAQTARDHDAPLISAEHS